MSKINWKKYPCIRILILLSAGLLLGKAIQVPVSLLIIPFVLVGCGAYVLTLNRPAWRSLAPVTGILLAAVLLSIIHREQSPAAGMDYSGMAIITAALEERPKTYRTIIQFHPGLEPTPTIRSLAYIRKNSRAAALLPGDRIIIKARLQMMESPDLPGQFNYAKYMQRRKVIYSTFIDSTAWQPHGGISRALLTTRKATRLRNHFTEVIDHYIDREAAGLVKAMVLGLRTDLDPETKTAFAQAGIMHILAVSGLHVSIIWLLISMVHSPLTSRVRWLKNWGILVEVLVVWGFALLTGFGPAVQRAAFMFSLLSVSKLSGLKGQAVNLAAASAVILLILQPQLLMEAGFQLSYAAVFGILLFYRKIRSLYYFKNPILSYMWSLEAVSFSAVLGTAPVSIFYFHQFPLIFPLANLLAVPSAFLIVGGTVTLFIFSWFNALSRILGWLLSKLVSFLIDAGEWMGELPASALEKLYIDRLEVFLLYGLMIALLLLIHKVARPPALIAASLFILCILFLYEGISTSVEYREMEWYQTGNRSAPTQLVNIGKKQLVFTAPSSDRDFNYPLAGNHKYDRIYTVDSLHWEAARIDSFLSQLPVTGPR